MYCLDSATNEKASNGFVSYSIQAVKNVPENTLVSNTAYIYFDQNPAIVTNTTYNNLVTTIPRVNVIGDNIGFTKSMIYPNPTSGFITISGAEEGDVLDIKSVFGQSVYQVAVTDKMRLSTQELSSGIYFYQIKRDGKVIDTGKLIKD